MASPRQHRPLSRLVIAILAGGIALTISLVAVSGVFMASDEGDSKSDTSDARPRANPADPTEPADEPAGPPAKVELRRVLKVLAQPVDCGDAEVWCADDNSVGGYRLGPVELRTKDIVNAEARISDYGDYVVGITLSDAGAGRFEQVTTELAENAGARAQLAIVVDGRVLSAPEVQSPIAGGEIDIAADFTQATAERLAAAIDP